MVVMVCVEKDGYFEVVKVFNGFIVNYIEIWEKWGFRLWWG